ncbi:MAG: DMT family transporter [Tissierellaceae bacterium]
MSLEGSLSINLGDKLTLICAVFFALHIISIGIHSKNHDPIILSIIQFGVVAILSLLTGLIFKVEFVPMTREISMPILYLAIVNTIIAFGIQNIAQKYTTSTHAAIILSLESVFGSFFSILLLGEKFTIRLFLGCVIIFLAVITAETKWSFLNIDRIVEETHDE